MSTLTLTTDVALQKLASYPFHDLSWVADDG